MAFQIKNNIPKKSILTKEISWRPFKFKVSDGFKEYLFNQLSVLLSSGIDLKSSIQLLLEESTKTNEKKILEELNDLLIQGKSLSQSMAINNSFSIYEIQSIAIGEETGKILNVLNELKNYYSSKIKQRRQLISALTYPIIVLSVALGAISFLLFYMVPMFQDVFNKFNKDLPSITQWVIHTSNFLKSYSLYFLASIILFLILHKRLINNTKYKSMYYSILLRFPLIGDFIHKIYLIRWCKAISLMLYSKIPLVEAIQLSKGIVDFYPIQSTLQDIVDGLLRGEPLFKELAKHKIFPSKMILMIKIAEQVNKLDTFFDQLGKQYQEEVEHKTSILSSMLEPFIILFLGAIVSFVLIAMYLPMFELGSLF
jgi:type IV pilus assembly protein PilC